MKLNLLLLLLFLANTSYGAKDRGQLLEPKRSTSGCHAGDPNCGLDVESYLLVKDAMTSEMECFIEANGVYTKLNSISLCIEEF